MKAKTQQAKAQAQNNVVAIQPLETVTRVPFLESDFFTALCEIVALKSLDKSTFTCGDVKLIDRLLYEIKDGKKIARNLIELHYNQQQNTYHVVNLLDGLNKYFSRVENIERLQKIADNVKVGRFEIINQKTAKVSDLMKLLK